MLNFQNVFSVFHITAQTMTSKDGRHGNMTCWGPWEHGMLGTVDLWYSISEHSTWLSFQRKLLAWRLMFIEESLSLSGHYMKTSTQRNCSQHSHKSPG